MVNRFSSDRVYRRVWRGELLDEQPYAGNTSGCGHRRENISEAEVATCQFPYEE
jgi:hypothetical protein